MTYEQLADLAAKTIIKVMQEGEAKHPENDYMEREIKEHHRRAFHHIMKSRLSKDKDELEHALTRIAIILAKLEGGKKCIRCENDLTEIDYPTHMTDGNGNNVCYYCWNGYAKPKLIKGNDL